MSFLIIMGILNMELGFNNHIDSVRSAHCTIESTYQGQQACLAKMRRQKSIILRFPAVPEGAFADPVRLEQISDPTGGGRVCLDRDLTHKGSGNRIQYHCAPGAPNNPRTSRSNIGYRVYIEAFRFTASS
jgi:hypothetical protein